MTKLKDKNTREYRLYHNITTPEQEMQGLEAIIRNLKRERDEARRRICEMSLQIGKVFRRIDGKTVEVTTPEGCAEIMRWDCFKENTNV